MAIGDRYWHARQVADDDTHQQDATSAALLAELHRVYGRMTHNDENTTLVIQFIVLVFGAGVVAANVVPEAIVAVPIFWTVWLMHSVVVDVNTLKYSVVAADLEQKANTLLAVPVFCWETSMAERGHKRPLIFNANYVYWGVLNGAGWTLAIVIYVQEGLWYVAIGLAVTWALTWSACIYTSLRREHMLLGFARRLGATTVDNAA